jgi:WD40 repeat protein
MYIYIFIYVYIFFYVYIYIYRYIYINVYVYTYPNEYTYTYKYTDCTVNIWNLNQKNYENLLKPHISLNHENSVKTVNFHPTISGLLCTSSLDFKLRLFDIEKGMEKSKIILNTNIVNKCFNFDGSLLCFAGKDKKVLYSLIRISIHICTCMYACINPHNM